MIMKISMSDVKIQALLVNQPKKSFAMHQSIHFAQTNNADNAYWLLMIRDLIEGAGYNYSRIAKCIDVCPSTIQKLITHPSRRPRQTLFEKLLVLYHKVFHGPYLTKRVQDYLQKRPVDVLSQLPQSWVKKLVAAHAATNIVH